MAAAIALTVLRPFIPDGLSQLLCLLLQQAIQRFFHASAYQFPEFFLDYSLIKLYDFLGHIVGLLCMSGYHKPILSSGLHMSFLILRNLLYVIASTYRYIYLYCHKVHPHKEAYASNGE